MTAIEQARWDGVSPLFSFPIGTHVLYPEGVCKVIVNCGVTRCLAPEHQVLPSKADLPRHLPRKSGVGARRVLHPLTGRAARHLWADRLAAARAAGRSTPNGDARRVAAEVARQLEQATATKVAFVTTETPAERRLIRRLFGRRSA